MHYLATALWIGICIVLLCVVKGDERKWWPPRKARQIHHRKWKW